MCGDRRDDVLRFLDDQNAKATRGMSPLALHNVHNRVHPNCNGNINGFIQKAQAVSEEYIRSGYAPARAFKKRQIATRKK